MKHEFCDHCRVAEDVRLALAVMQKIQARAAKVS